MRVSDRAALGAAADAACIDGAAAAAAAASASDADVELALRLDALSCALWALQDAEALITLAQSAAALARCAEEGGVADRGGAPASAARAALLAASAAAVAHALGGALSELQLARREA